MSRQASAATGSGAQTSDNSIPEERPRKRIRLSNEPSLSAAVIRAAPRPRPHRRENVEIAVICALPLEYDAVSLVADAVWDDYGNYKVGRIGKHNVVLALLSSMGKASASSTAASIRECYRRVRLALVVGICGAVPQPGGEEILLGDIVISNAIVQYDFGAQYPDGFKRKRGAQDNIRKPDKDVCSQLRFLEAAEDRHRLQKKAAEFLGQLQARAAQKGCGAKYNHPGASEDKLFEPSYRQRHHVSTTCICSTWKQGSDPVCDDAMTTLCDDLGCSEKFLVPRKRFGRGVGEEATRAGIHVGPIGSGDMVVKSGEHRDRIARPDGIIAFEMEGAGVAVEIPCIVAKGVCDYADCHKNKKWQNFAAATAACALKAVLERLIQS